MAGDPNQRKSVTFEDMMKHKAKTIGGEAMTPAAKARAAGAGQVKLLTERAEVLGLTPAQYVQAMNLGKVPKIEGLPAKFVQKLAAEMPPPAQGNVVPPVQQAQPAQTTAPEQSITPASSPPPAQPAGITEDDLRALGLVNNPGATAAQVASQNMEFADAGQEPIYAPVPPAPKPVQPPQQQAQTQRPLNLDHLTHPMWQECEAHLKFEQVVACMLELKANPNKIRDFQELCNTYGPRYLDELLKRMQWKCLYMKNRMAISGTAGNINFPRVMSGMRMYEQLFTPISEFMNEEAEDDTEGENTSTDT